MRKRYTYPPENITEIEEYVLNDKAEVVDYLLTHDNYYFYDTCSFRYHMNLSAPTEVLSYYIAHDAAIIIVSTVMGELASDSGILGKKEVTYIQRMYEAGIKVLLLSEEWMIDVLRECYSGIEKVNLLLSQSVKEAIPPYSAVRDMIKSTDEFYDVFLISKSSSNSEIGYKLFEEIHKLKKENDDLGETMILLCVRLMFFIPSDSIKICVMSDDKGAGIQLGKLIQRISNGFKRLCLITTPKLCWVLNRKFGVEDSDVLYSLLDCISNADLVRVLCSGEYDMTPLTITVEKRELIRRITDDRTLTVFS